jgi:hypothetical protein
VRIAGLLSGGERQLRAFLEQKAAASAGIEFLTLPRFTPVALFP